MGRPKQTWRQMIRISPGEIALASGVAPPPQETVEKAALALARLGQREPLLVTPNPDWDNGKSSRRAAPYRLVMGGPHLLAGIQLGWPNLDCILLDPKFSREIAVIQRLETGRFDPWELSDTMLRLKGAHGWTQVQLGLAIGKSRDFVANILSIASITAEVRQLIHSHSGGAVLSARHLRYIGRTVPGRQAAVAEEILERGLSTKVLEDRRKGRPAPRRQFLKMRKLGGEKRNRTVTDQELRKYYRKINTDLRRLERQEKEEVARLEAAVKLARGRKKMIRNEAREKRRILLREQKRTRLKLERAGRI